MVAVYCYIVYMGWSLLSKTVWRISPSLLLMQKEETLITEKCTLARLICCYPRRFFLSTHTSHNGVKQKTYVHGADLYRPPYEGKGGPVRCLHHLTHSKEINHYAESRMEVLVCIAKTSKSVWFRESERQDKSERVMYCVQ